MIIIEEDKEIPELAPRWNERTKRVIVRRQR